MTEKLEYDEELRRLGLPTTKDIRETPRTTYFEAKNGLSHAVSCLITLHNSGEMNKATYNNLISSPLSNIIKFLEQREGDKNLGSRKK